MKVGDLTLAESDVATRRGASRSVAYCRDSVRRGKTAELTLECQRPRNRTGPMSLQMSAVTWHQPSHSKNALQVRGRILTLLPSRRVCSYACVLAMARATLRAGSWMLRVTLRCGVGATLGLQRAVATVVEARPKRQHVAVATCAARRQVGVALRANVAVTHCIAGVGVSASVPSRARICRSPGRAARSFSSTRKRMLGSSQRRYRRRASRLDAEGGLGALDNHLRAADFCL